MAMRCPKCGNELNQEEAFCGQCGAPSILSTRPGTGVIHHAPTDAPAPHTAGLLHSYGRDSSRLQSGPDNSQPAPPSNPYNTNGPQASPYATQPAPWPDPNPPGPMPPPANAYNLRTSPPSQPLRPPRTDMIHHAPSQAGQPSSPPQSSNLHQPTGFYQDATEAMVVSPINDNPNYPQNGFPAAYPQRPVPPMYNPQMQPFQANNQTSPGYPPLQAFPSGQGYNYATQPNATPPPKQRGNVFLIIVCIMFVFAFLIATGVGAIYLLRNQSSQATTPASTSAPTATPIPSPTPSVTPISSPTPTPMPSPALTPTPAPASGFSFCDASCTTNGYSVEYPSTWKQGTTSDSTGVEFKNPAAHDEFAAFKATSSSGSDTATDLVNNDLQNNFASQQNYTAPTTSQSTTIGGVTWVYSVATYMLNNQAERIQVYATVRQGKNYIIELQAADAQFDDINNQYFVTMLGNFQFQSGS